MSDGYGYGPSDPHGPQPEIIGYDEYGRPVYRRQDSYGPRGGGGSGYGTPADGTYGQGGTYDGSGSPYGEGGAYAGGGSYGGNGPYDSGAPYETGPYGVDGGSPGADNSYGAFGRSEGAQQAGHATYGGHPGRPGDPAEGYGYGHGSGAYDPYGQQQPQQAPHPAQQQAPSQPGRQAQHGPQARPGPHPQESSSAQQEEYRTEEFAFVEETSDDSEDVIDWLKFTESRTERREEAKRRGRNRTVALVVALALVLAGGVGYLWYAGMLPGTGGGDDAKNATAAGQHRDVVVVHLREESGASSTALLVDNAGTGQGTTLLLPNALAVTTEDGTTTTLGRSVDDQGAGPTRDALNTLLGSDIKGTWRLDTPFLEKLVELVGGISLDTDTAVPGAKKGSSTLVERGTAQNLDGRAAVAYATYRGQGEPQGKQLARFGQVMRAVLGKISAEPRGATRTVESLGQIPDPSLSESELGPSLAKLAAHAKKGDYRTQVLPVQANGTLGEQAGDKIVAKVLGGTVKNSDPHAAPRVSLKNATGRRGLDNTASVALVNGGYTVVKGGNGAARTASLVTYAKAADKDKAQQIAKTLGLSGSAVRKAEGAANADVTVVLGADYRG